MELVKISWGIFLDLLTVPIAKLNNFITNAPPSNWSVGEKGDVILVHGFGDKWSYLTKIGNSVNSLGYKVHVLQELGRNTFKIAMCSRILENYIQEKSIKNAVVICHSKGGVITKYFLIHSKQAKNIKGVISIAVPFGGFLFAYVHIFNLYELTPTSSLIKELKKNNSINGIFVNIRTKVDDIILPNKNTLLPGAENITTNVVGHLRILRAQETLDVIGQVLKND
jgi:triacylglycerol lipase